MAILYKSSRFYHALMAIVYRKHRHEHFQAVAEWIPDGAKVLDVCCGDGRLTDYLPSSVDYRGLDQSPVMVNAGRQQGRDINEFDLRQDNLPQLQIIVCQVSLFQFHPKEKEVLARLFEAAQQRLIITESVFSLTQSRWSWISSIVAWGTRVDDMSDTHFRFTPETLAELFLPYKENLQHNAEICGGRDWIYILDK